MRSIGESTYNALGAGSNPHLWRTTCGRTGKPRHYWTGGAGVMYQPGPRRGTAGGWPYGVDLDAHG